MRIFGQVVVFFTFLTNTRRKFRAKRQLRREFLTLVLSKTTFAQSVLHKFFLKEQIEVPSILLTTQTNLAKLKNALSVSTHALGQNVRIFFQVVVLFSFYTKDSSF